MNFTSIKYPRTPHLPFSPAYSSDDEMLMNLKDIIGENVVVTEKMDGENTTLYSTHLHARTINEGRKHESRDWMKHFWGSISLEIPKKWRICGENLYAKHSIYYQELPSYFMGFSVWNENNICLSWDHTQKLFEKIGIVSVPVLYRGKWDWAALTNVAASLDLEKQEGFVVRLESDFSFDDFQSYVGKWVRKNHIENENKNWFNSKVVKNGQRKGASNIGS